MIVKRITTLFFLIWGLTGCFVDEDSRPVADAGPDKIVFVSLSGADTVQLSGEASFDPNGDALDYHWIIESTPIGSNATLDKYNGQKVKLTLDKIGVYEIGLIVDDGVSPSNKDIVIIEYRSSRGGGSSATSGDSGIIGSQPGHVALEDGTPNDSCSECHNGIKATGKSLNHIQSTDQCDSCHATTQWIPVILVDHSQVNGDCASCHNGFQAMGKSVVHIVSTDLCGACHSTMAFLPVITVDHAQILGACFNCHNNVIARGNPPYHVTTTNVCEACHSTDVFVPVLTVDHNEVLGNCFECHNGTVATGKPSTHIESSQICESCHNTFSWLIPSGASPVGGSTGGGGKQITFDHTGIKDGCVSCHKDVMDQATGTFHSVATSAYCEACHSVNSWVPANVNHTIVSGPCVDCHNGNVATGKTSVHINTDDICDACHVVTNWVPVVVVDHNSVLGDCASCHGAPSAHVALGVTANCESCHTSSNWQNAINPLPTPVPANSNNN